MSKGISQEFKDHLAGEVTTLATCWRLVRKDQTEQGFTDHVKNIPYDGLTYEASTGFTPSSIRSSEDLAVENLDVVGLLDSSGIDEGDLAAGLYDYADVYIFMVNYEDLTMGDMKLRRGKLGEVKHGTNTFTAEVRGLTQQLQQTIGEVFTTTCRADLGDERCTLLIAADQWAPRTYVAADDYLRATYSNHTNRKFKATTAGYSSSQEPTWNTTVDGTTTENDPETLTDGVFANALSVYWNGDDEWTISGGTATCDGTQTANTELVQDDELDINPVEGTPYFTSFDVAQAPDLVDDGVFASAKGVYWDGGVEWTIAAGVASCDGTQGANSSLTETPTEDLLQGHTYETSFEVSGLTAGQVRLVIGGTAGTWRTVDGTFTQDIAAGAGTDIEIEADSSFVGSIDNVISVPAIGQVRITIGDTAGTWRTTAGTHTEDLTAGAGASVSIEGDQYFIGDIDNASVTEKSDAEYITETSYLEIGTTTSVASNENFTDTSRPEADGFFNGGLLTMTSGDNAGLSIEVKIFASDIFQLVLPFPYNIGVGDEYEVYQGCDKQLETCRDIFDNILNFRAEPFIPGNDEVTKFGGQ